MLSIASHRVGNQCTTALIHPSLTTACLANCPLAVLKAAPPPTRSAVAMGSARRLSTLLVRETERKRRKGRMGRGEGTWRPALYVCGCEIERGDG